MAQSEPSIRDKLDQIDSDIDSSHRRKLWKINTRFPDLPDKLVLVGSEGRVQRMPKEAEKGRDALTVFKNHDSHTLPHQFDRLSDRHCCTSAA